MRGQRETDYPAVCYGDDHYLCVCILRADNDDGKRPFWELGSLGRKGQIHWSHQADSEDPPSLRIRL